MKKFLVEAADNFGENDIDSIRSIDGSYLARGSAFFCFEERIAKKEANMAEQTHRIERVEANEKRCKEMLEQSLAMVTALAPVIGYDHAAKIAKEAFTTGKTVREVVLARKILAPEKLSKILDPWRMTEPGIPEKDDDGTENGGSRI